MHNGVLSTFGVHGRFASGLGNAVDLANQFGPLHRRFGNWSAVVTRLP